MSETLNMQLAIPTGSIEAYTQAIHRIPVLSAEQERELAIRFKQDEDLDAARTLVISHLRFVLHIARGYNGYGLPLADLVQEGAIGLMKAVKRFDPDVGVRLVSFAVHWIRAEMHEYILRNWRIVKVATTKAQRKLFFNLRSSKKRLGWFSKKEVDAVAHDLGVSPEQVLEMEKRLSGQQLSFDATGNEDDEQSVTTPAGYLHDEQMDPARQVENEDWETHNNHQLRHALGQLDSRSQDILQARWLNDSKATLQELADKYQISAERIRQLEKNAMKKLQNMLVA